MELRKAPLLLLILAVTTGWGDTTAAAYRSDDRAAGRPDADGTALAVGPTQISGVSSAIRLQERAPERVGPVEAPKPVRTEKAPKPERKAKPSKETKPARSTKPARDDSPRYGGSNRFWIPSLGISDRVHLFECSRQRPPDNYMYRWGCAGQNNVYIMGHAYSVMKPLHDAYVRGRLKVGMVAIYANGNGKVTRYRVTEWRVVDPVDSHWAIADQPVPSMTLQTCVGKNGRLRLNVRLVAVD